VAVFLDDLVAALDALLAALLVVAAPPLVLGLPDEACLEPDFWAPDPFLAGAFSADFLTALSGAPLAVGREGSPTFLAMLLAMRMVFLAAIVFLAAVLALVPLAPAFFAPAFLAGAFLAAEPAFLSGLINLPFLNGS
jgi:hypothetical protein